MPSRPDVRLVVPAACAWAGALAVRVGLDHRIAVLVCSLAVAALVVMVGLATVVVRGMPWRPVALLVAAGLLGAGAGAVASAVHLAPLHAEPVATWTVQRAIVDVEGVITGESVVRTSTRAAVWQDRTSRVMPVATTRVATAAEAVDVQVPLQARLPGGVDAALVPGALVHLHGRLVRGHDPDTAGVLVVDIAQVRAGPGVLDRVTHAMRIAQRSVLRAVPADAGALVAGLSVGDTTLAPPELVHDMRVSGLSHLTAVSGGNVAIVLGLVLGVLALLRVPLVMRVVVALAALVGFTVLVGPQPSVLRSVAMGAVIVLALLSGGRRAGPSVLAAAVLLLVVLVPSLAASWGFALSVAATAGLILLSPPLQSALAQVRVAASLPPRIREGIALTVAAQVATLPVMAAMGAFAGLASVPANLLAEPLVAPVTVLGLACAVLAPWWPWAAAVVAHVASIPAQGIALIAHACPSLPFAGVGWPSGVRGIVAIVVLAAAAAALTWSWRRGARVAPIIVAGLVVAGLLIAAMPRRAWPPPGWFVIACDVGQGDALLLPAGPHAAVLVDTGPDPDLVDACLSRAGIDELPAIVLTHFHADHVDGLPGALRRRRVGVVLVSPVREPAADAAAVDGWTRGLPVQAISAGDVRTIAGITWRALWPARRIDAGSVPNNASIVLDATVDGHRVLLSGDVEREAQAAILPLLHPFDVVKVPHHGSGNFDPLLPGRAPAPIAVISVGAGNPYGHPHPRTLAAWQGIGARVMRTDEHGDIAVVGTPTGIGVVPRS